MKQKLSLITLAALLAAASQANAQGLLSIGNFREMDFDRQVPLTWTLGAQVGWDSNVNLSDNNEQDSGYLSAVLGMNYTKFDRRQALDVSLDYSPLYYFDAPAGQDDYQHNARLSIDFRRRINPRMTLTNSFYIAYEVEPNYGIGATVARRTQPYLYGYNSTALAYTWTRRFSTVTSYTITGVDYDGVGNDYLTHIFSNEFRYALSRTTTLAASYRFAKAEFDFSASDYDSHYLLAGVDHRFDPRLTGSFRAGVEFRGDTTDPYVESALTYRVARMTDLRWYTQYGLQSNGSSEDTTFRTGLTASHRFDKRLVGTGGVHYISEDVDAGFFGGQFDQDILALSVGFEYALFNNVSLNGGYSFTTSMSDQEYDRHMVQVGFASRF